MLLFFSNALNAQLQARFTADRSGGCSPLTVSFTNQSTGPTSNTSYHWDFGNGNISTLPNPSAIFIDEQSYNVTLTIKNGTQSASYSMKIEVYKKPEVDFTSSSAKGCIPFDARFTADAKPGSGYMASYHWDFGDGFTSQQSTPTVNHIYNHVQPATVSLTVKNNYGCHTTIVKKDLLTVLPEMKVDFEADQRVLCNVTDAVQFTNKSEGPGTLTYLWDYGDGQTSVDASPSYAFNKKGTYTVKLTATSSEGCQLAKTQTNYLNVANYSTDLKTPPLVCKDATVLFEAVCSPDPNRIDWEVDGNVYNYYWSRNFSNSFYTTGAHNVKVTTTYGNCQVTKSHNFTVEDLPKLDGFVMDLNTICGAPTTVQFKDTSKDAVRWEWDFDYYYYSPSPDAYTRNAAKLYNSNTSQYIALRTYNAAGCSRLVQQYLQIQEPWVDIFRTDTLPKGHFVGCGPSKLKFKANSQQTIVKYKWTFDNSTTSNDPEPEYTFSSLGYHYVKLEYETDKGCKGTKTYYGEIQIRSTLKADFTSTSGKQICGNTPVYFQSIGNTNSSYEYWYINGAYVGTSYYNNFTYQFSEKGKYTISLIRDNYGCRDTITKVDFLEVLPPFPKISRVENSCDKREQVTFTQNSRYGEIWAWDFGDGQTASYTTDQTVITHNYAASGKYKVVLTVTNGQCSVRDSTFAYVHLKPSPLLSAPKLVVCPNDPFDFKLSNLPPHAYDGAWVYYYFHKIEYGDGTPFTGYHNNWQNWVNPLPYEGQLINLDPAKNGLRMILSESYFGCYDTTNLIPIVVNGTRAGFRILNNDACFNNDIRFEDTSKVSTGNKILEWIWDFGDGQTISRNTGGIVQHRYANPGYYYVTLKVRDAAGCVLNSSQFNNYVRVNGPKAAISSSGTVFPVNSVVYFHNFTNTFNVSNPTYKWEFGSAAQSTDYAPTYTFTAPGKYLVKLTATDPATGCSSTDTREITIEPVKNSFSFTKTLIGQNSCLPLLANFSVTAYNIDSLSWDFGDGTVAGDLRYATHVYDKPGRYYITLTARGTNGLIYRHLDSVIITAPAITAIPDDLDGCIGHTVNWTLSGKHALNYAWDFGDGTISQLPKAQASHLYSKPGTYSPSLLVSDSNGCLINTAIAHRITVYPDPVIKVNAAAAVACLGKPLQLSATGGKTYIWTPATGLDNPRSHQPFATPAQTTTYKIQGTDEHGCSSTADYTLPVQLPFKVQVKPPVEICEGQSTTLQAAGADRYAWIYSTQGLNNTQTPTPVASPTSSTQYTVVGYDNNNCFTDTAQIMQVVNPLPTVNAGSDKEIQTGEKVTLTPQGSNDVVKWNWTPATWLNCSTCPSPVSSPETSITYKVTVQTKKGCEASDELFIKMACAETHIRIPNAFTPNNDGRNDAFEIRGVSVVKHLSIYNRWGNKIFEKNEFNPFDRAGCWDGTLNGIPQPTGSYVYMIQVKCPSGEMFVKKGTVLLIR
ncbi:PKD domain-containing protein [Pseudoflavitalea rhizosphaerae]|uniref:PKD domain-containing protein n=1 Tax=Pseudoflavitalea rhizosphaerae TaxID=1884793 RepID=UPI0013E02656|nr:PKD domain-containing protein [Pseudoflavitalea rhizosphaerae]